jgi:glutathione peroxidase
VTTLFDFQEKTLDGKDQKLADFKGKAVLVVNVASKCGLTPQYAGLQKLYDTYAKRGFAVLGFPCNQFAGQEPGSESEIAEFCSRNYGVTFPMFSKIDVNGPKRDPLYAWLAAQPTQPDGPGDILWNFGKFLVDKQGQVVARFNPRVAPDAAELTSAIEKVLG